MRLLSSAMSSSARCILAYRSSFSFLNLSARSSARLTSCAQSSCFDASCSRVNTGAPASTVELRVNVAARSYRFLSCGVNTREMAVDSLHCEAFIASINLCCMLVISRLFSDN